MSAPGGFALVPVPRRARPAREGWRDVQPDAAARAIDNAILTAVRLRRWMSVPAVAREIGQPPDWVRKVTAEVEAHDMATPDPRASAAEVAAAYAWHRGGRS